MSIIDESMSNNKFPAFAEAASRRQANVKGMLKSESQMILQAIVF
jgi:hypothetical protein